ncbi:pectinesterase inhibitor 9-like [Prosopis cineraria]|uniref:pectinesterase inhibitor 9-like n=1 Tax=Prosopis cineraria TaxID=364024 RepID=UPI0024101F31|nr:pectinesterase inhibitor 9-like [Prosopis cineraria]
MAQLINLTLLVMMILISLFSIHHATAEPSFKRPHRYKPQTVAYIKGSCQTTLYPNLCLRCLYKYSNSKIQSPQELAHVALSVSLSRALYTRDYLMQVAKQFKALKNRNNNRSRDYFVLQDCLKQINDSVYQLGLSIKELERLNKIPSTMIRDGVLWHMSNVETWVSTALTDASTCVDYFPAHRMSKMKAAIRGKVLNVAQVTSNALALFHRYATKYREAAQAKNKP